MTLLETPGPIKHDKTKGGEEKVARPGPWARPALDMAGKPRVLLGRGEA